MSNSVHEFPTPGLGDAKRYVVLALEESALLLAQPEVLALESVLDMSSAASVPRSVGTLQVGGDDCPVYALDRDLNCLPALPARHRICAVLNHPQGAFALSCCEVRMVERAALTLHQLPRAFAARSGPLRTLVVMEGHLLLGSSAAALLAHVGERREAAVISFEAHARKARP